MTGPNRTPGAWLTDSSWKHGGPQDGELVIAPNPDSLRAPGTDEPRLSAWTETGSEPTTADRVLAWVAHRLLAWAVVLLIVASVIWGLGYWLQWWWAHP